jgi:hypothetical protein
MYKWMIFIISSGNLDESISESGSEDKSYRIQNKLEKKTKMLNIILIISQIIIKIAFITTVVGFSTAIDKP